MTSERRAAASTDGALRIVTWSGLASVFLTGFAMGEYAGGFLLDPTLAITFIFVTGCLMSGLLRRIARVDEARGSSNLSAMGMMLGAGIAAALVVLDHLGILSGVNLYLCVTLAFWLAVTFVLSVVVELRRNVRLYLALEGLVVRHAGMNRVEQ